MKQVQGFTLLEVIVAMVVIVILSTAAISGARNLLHRQRFTADADQVRLMIQQARNRSQTQVDGAKTYGVFIPGAGAGNVQLFEDNFVHDGAIGAQDVVIDTLPIDPFDFKLNLFQGAQPCLNNAAILFTTNKTTATMYCDGVSANVNSLKIQVASTQQETLVREYLILKESGTVQ